MARATGKVTKLVIDALISPCAHTCRYCSIGDRTFSSIPLSRLIVLFDRFTEWKTARGNNDLSIQWSFLGPSYNYDVATLGQLLEFQRRVGVPFIRIPLGGLKMLPEAGMREWLAVRKELGITGIAATMAGHGEVHDRWNGRDGDFEFMVLTQRLATELGLEIHQGFLVGKSTLPILDEAAGILDRRIGPATRRYARIFMAAGYGAYREDERITESDLADVPKWVTELFQTNEYIQHRPERDWIEHLRRNDPGRKEDILLHLSVNEKTIGRFEATGCEEIIEDLERRTRSVYNGMPSREELREISGDPRGRRIYDSAFDLERIWMDRYLEKQPLDLDWSLAPHHLGKGRSKRPPPLAISEIRKSADMQAAN